MVDSLAQPDRAPGHGRLAAAGRLPGRRGKRRVGDSRPGPSWRKGPRAAPFTLIDQNSSTNTLVTYAGENLDVFFCPTVRHMWDTINWWPTPGSLVNAVKSWSNDTVRLRYFGYQKFAMEQYTVNVPVNPYTVVGKNEVFADGHVAWYAHRDGHLYRSWTGQFPAILVQDDR